MRRGGRARLKASDSKSDRGVSPSGVQILSPPPFFPVERERGGTASRGLRFARVKGPGTLGGPPGEDRRGGRVAEGAALEMPCTGNCTVGSNPTPSAIKFCTSRRLRRAPAPEGRAVSPTDGDLMRMPVGAKGSAARRRAKVAREAYSLYVERATERANEADGPLSTTGAAWPC